MEIGVEGVREKEMNDSILPDVSLFSLFTSQIILFCLSSKNRRIVFRSICSILPILWYRKNYILMFSRKKRDRVTDLLKDSNSDTGYLVRKAIHSRHILRQETIEAK